MVTATHAAISVPTEEETIAYLGDRENWRVQVCDRGFFRVVEFWVENRLLLERLPPAMASEYLIELEKSAAYFEQASVAVG